MSSETAPNDWLTTKEAATLLGVQEQTLRLRRQEKWKGEPGPPWHRVMGRILYKRGEVQAYIDACVKAPRPRRLRPLSPPPP